MAGERTDEVLRAPPPPASASSEDAPSPFPLLQEPRDGIPAVTATAGQLDEAVERLDAGTGPVAIDAERASGHRYGQRAFLVQLRRERTGTLLIDPVDLPDLGRVGDAMLGAEWVLHAATQDLPCLAELGLQPTRLFDTELAGRLLGLPRVGLAGLTEDLLGVHLAKGHGAADWSKRPLPVAWLAYAALDVELLLELREVLSARLAAAGRDRWAAEEFEALVGFRPRVHPQPWRRTAGIHRVKERRSLAVLRELWSERDELARSVDRPPGRILPDTAVVAAARALPASREALANLPEFARQRRAMPRWWRAIQRGMAVPEPDLPERTVSEGPPPPRTWDRRNPEAAARLAAVRAAVNGRAEALGLSPEVLIAPDPVRCLVWEAGDRSWDPAEVAARLAAAGARPWQCEIVAPLIAAALQAAA